MASLVQIFVVVVSGDAYRVRDTVGSALSARGLSVNWADAWTAKADKGSATKQAIAGSFAPHHRIDVLVRVDSDKTLIYFSRMSTGLTGGLLGRARATKLFSTVTSEVANIFL